MNEITEKWFSPVPWQTVLSLNEDFCKEKEVPHSLKSSSAKVKGEWEAAYDKAMPLKKALQLCKSAHEQAPFEFFNANTFTKVGVRMLEDGLNRMPGTDAQMVRTTVSHYIAGQIEDSELNSVLKYSERAWKDCGAGAGDKPNQSPSLPPKATEPPRATDAE